MRSFKLILSALLLSAASIPDRHAYAGSFEFGKWAYNCMHDHKDPYGTVLNPRNCWASICGAEAASQGEGCISIFYLTDDRWGLGRNISLPPCEYTPQEIAVDGQRIDLLSDREQIEAVTKAKSLTRRLWKRSWPYCETKDVTVSLDGSAEVFKRIEKLSPTFINRPD